MLLLAAADSMVGAAAFVLLFGVGFGAGTIARPALLAQTFGTARYATVAGVLSLVITLATTASPLAAGLARTATGSYLPVLVAVAGLCLVGAGGLLRANALGRTLVTACVRT